ncbi:hypothetical protein ACERIM_09180 [Natrinema sp. H-ect1]|uniref:hypothetical protein n=1 Tax=Natrinema sp. H-ect1 TaxID=3242700 RepID=UPI00359D7A5C
MSETTEPTAETIELPTKAEAELWLNELEQQGETVELECGQCGDFAEATVPRDEKEETQKTLCRGCGTDHLKDVGML